MLSLINRGVGSSPTRTTRIPRGVAQRLSAPRLGRGGRGFKSHHPDTSGSSSVGRASPFQGEGRRFDPGLPLKKGMN